MSAPYVIKYMFAENPRVQGKVLNVGLGEGHSARAFLRLRDVTDVTSVDIDQGVIDAYNATWSGDSLESLHTIMNVDAANIPANYTTKFGFIYVDLITSFQQATFDTIKAFILKAKNDLMTASSRLVVEYQADVPIEREFRVHWITQHFDDELVNVMRGGSIRLYRLK